MAGGVWERGQKVAWVPLERPGVPLLEVIGKLEEPRYILTILELKSNHPIDHKSSLKYFSTDYTSTITWSEGLVFLGLLKE